ncbi:cupin domain-containing protein [Deinococcus sp. KSM4-11]|uniref:cupin domain-containing protein n=1 Tax=Deinococcus sp. KSM4-11 TaxID=2568654 RepID=UPI0010A43ADE|nr:cupin domain-containing protein [Deinococcus sp. KSM4-11]THF86803.1 cupin domain-containing protein [Deinococcus sp. KSM4-11]
MSAEELSLPQGGRVPNSALPACLYRAALRGLTPPQIEAHLAARGWSNSWRNGIYSFHHYHSTAHEVLVVARGHVTVTLGGEDGVQRTVEAGDVLVLPAGTGHRNDGSSADLLVIGAYAGGRAWDTCRPDRTDPDGARRRIAQVPLWTQEPAG